MHIIIVDVLNNTMHRLCSTASLGNPKTGVVMLNMGGPENVDQVHDYLLRIMTDREMIQLPLMQEYVLIIYKSFKLCN